MNKTIPVIFSFVFGAAAGGVVTWQLLKDKYEKKMEEEIASVKKAYERYENSQGNIDESSTIIANVDTQLLSSIMNTTRYVPPIPDIPKQDKPYVIQPDEFGDLYDYNKIYLTFFADGAVADEEMDILTDDEIEESFGHDALTQIGKYEADVVHVRNDAKKCDYEITVDLRNYSELIPDDYEE